ncbi:alpha/beta hydrolase [Rhodococcus pyridinivorans]|uniref:alpha/beta hydrolase n=1 Tax=Rhodococcus pyridinivorans TaxID=103816 RepID=UPI0020C7F205|nr:alpha/beta hydrolase [Rhodococcus pyridinivorans]
MNETPVEDLRAALAAHAIPATTPIHHRQDIVVPSAGGGVPVRIYRPSDAPGLPVVQWMHSGGFAVGNLDQNEEYLRTLSIASQAVIVSVDYRLAPEHPCPAALDDCRAVWEWIASAPDELRSVDATRVVIAGESAGGALTFALSHQLRDEGLPLPAAQISLYGTAVMEVTNPEHATALLSPEDCYWFWGMYVPDPADRTSRQASPGLAPDLGGLPPALVVTTEIDPTRDGTEEYARRMQEAGVPVDLRRYEGMMHGFATMTTVLPAAKELFGQIVDYLAEVFTRQR